MIRINLLGVSHPKRGKRAAAAAPGVGGGGPNMLVVLLIVAALAAAGNYYYFWNLQKDAAKLKTQMDAAVAENRRLSDIKARYIELEKQKDIYERRVNVIHQLQANQMGPTMLLNTIGDTVNKTDAVWLNSMKDDGNTVSLDGVALSVDAVAQLMLNLKKTGYFKNIEIKESFQDDVVKDVTAFSFTLVCEKQPQQKS